MTSHGENVSINKTIQCIERERDHLQRNFILSLTYIFLKLYFVWSSLALVKEASMIVKEEDLDYTVYGI